MGKYLRWERGKAEGFFHRESFSTKRFENSKIYSKVEIQIEDSLVWKGALSDWIIYSVHSFTIEPLDGGKRTIILLNALFRTRLQSST